MKRAFTAWKWSLGVAARSYRIVVVLAALIALWAFAAYEWLALPESSALLLILAFLWAIAQLLAAAVIVGGIVSGVAEAAGTDARSLPLRSLWTINRRSFLNALIFFLISLLLVWICGAVFSWINEHSEEVASFLMFHSEKAISRVPFDTMFNIIERLLWIVLSGFLLSFVIALLRVGWREARKQTVKLLAGCAFRAPFLTTLLSRVVFGGVAFTLANWHPIVPPGFWDYTQMIVRFSLALILISAGVLFWSLSLACLQVPKQDKSDFI